MIPPSAFLQNLSETIVSKSRLVSSLFVVAFCFAAAIAASAQTLTTLYTFDFYHGRRPHSPLVQGLNGNFFGTTFTAGTPTMAQCLKLHRRERSGPSTIFASCPAAAMV